MRITALNCDHHLFRATLEPMFFTTSPPNRTDANSAELAPNVLVFRTEKADRTQESMAVHLRKVSRPSCQRVRDPMNDQSRWPWQCSCFRTKPKRVSKMPRIHRLGCPDSLLVPGGLLLRLCAPPRGLPPGASSRFRSPEKWKSIADCPCCDCLTTFPTSTSPVSTTFFVGPLTPGRNQAQSRVC